MVRGHGGFGDSESTELIASENPSVFFTLTAIALFSFIFPLLHQDFQISNAEPFIILLAPSVSLEITMGLGIFTCYSLYNLLKLVSSLVKELV